MLRTAAPAGRAVLCTWLRQQRNVPPGPRDGTSPPPPLPAHLWTPAYVYRYLISTRFPSLAESLIRVTGPYCSVNTHYTYCNFVRNRPPQAQEGDEAASSGGTPSSTQSMSDMQRCSPLRSLAPVQGPGH